MSPCSRTLSHEATHGRDGPSTSALSMNSAVLSRPRARPAIRAWMVARRWTLGLAYLLAGPLWPESLLSEITPVCGLHFPVSHRSS